MQWKGRRRSNNIEDLRNGGSRPDFSSLGSKGSGFGRMRASRRGKGGKRGLLGIVVMVGIAWFMGADPSTILNMVLGGGGIQTQSSSSSYSQPRSAAATAENDAMSQFIGVVLADTEDVWHAIYKQNGQRYVEPKLVLFSGSTPSACGTGKAAMGPFYCPADQKVYIDLSFYNDLKTRFKAPGDFAQAYVIAHEVGHHVQSLMGTSAYVHQQRSIVSKAEYNKLSVRLELQADCYAGVWANHADRTKQILEQGDIDEALNAASAIGDDRLQKQAQGRVVPESFTHGTSSQRQKWFRTGFKTGNVAACDTFKAANI